MDPRTCRLSAGGCGTDTVKNYTATKDNTDYGDLGPLKKNRHVFRENKNKQKKPGVLFLLSSLFLWSPEAPHQGVLSIPFIPSFGSSVNCLGTREQQQQQLERWFFPTHLGYRWAHCFHWIYFFLSTEITNRFIARTCLGLLFYEWDCSPLVL